MVFKNASLISQRGKDKLIILFETPKFNIPNGY